MKIVKGFVFVFFVLAIFVFNETNINGFEFNRDERLVYSARFLYVIPCGEAVIQVKDAAGYQGKKIILITCEAKTASWISLLFKAEAALNSYVDMKTLCPYKFEQILKIAGKPDDIRRAAYDRVNNIMDAEGKGKKKVPKDVRDPISAVYYLRAQQLKEGVEIKQVVNNNQSNYIFDSKVAGRKMMGKFNCWVLESKIRRENKSMYHSMDTKIYISDDERHIPVLIEAKTKVGPVALRLIKGG